MSWDVIYMLNLSAIWFYHFYLILQILVYCSVVQETFQNTVRVYASQNG